ncbi:MAG: hypothetical protein AAB621_01940 [Patescibacteria group bacterium]
MKIVMLHACKNIESLLITEINERLAEWQSQHFHVEIVSVNQMITLIPQVGCPDMLLTLVIVYK